MSDPYEVLVGDRVRAVVGSGGIRRAGVVTTVMRADFLQPNPQYLVLFDGDKGHSGPCHYAELEQPEPGQTP